MRCTGARTAVVSTVWKAAALLCVGLITACGKQGGSTNSSVGAPGSISYLSNPLLVPVGLAITANVPTADKNINSFSISPALPMGLIFNSTTGAITGTPTAAFSSPRSYTVTGTNAYGSNFTTLSLWVYTAPTITYAGPYSANVGYMISTFSPSASNGPISSCSISPGLPAGLSFDTGSCAVSGTPSATSGSTTYTVTATNASGSSTGNFTLQVLPAPAPNIAYPQNSYTLTKGAAMTAQQPSNAGGPFTGCSILPALPAGLAFNTTNCAISGTPTAISGATLYTVSTSGGTGADSTTVTITVNDAPPVISYSPNSYTFLDQHTISAVTAVNTGGAIASCAISPALPAGLSLNASTCQITGTPTALSSSTTYSVVATNSTGQNSNSAPITIRVNESVPNPAYPGNPFTFTKNTPIPPVTPTTTGGGPITACSVLPAVPAGISISSSCQILGTPTAVAATASYTLTASNSAGSTNVTISITVQDAAPAFSYPSSPYTFTKGNVISTIVPASTGGTITSCSVSPALPAGLSLNTTNCSISGTPTAVTSAANYTVTGTNSAGSSNATINITVNDVAPNISYAHASYNYTLSTAISPAETPANTGGAITNCTVSPALPAGIALSTTTCAFSGTPTTTSALTAYTITATNSGGNSAAAISLQVTNAAPSISYAGTPFTFTNGQAITTANVTNSGGSIGSCSVSPSLPGGLSFNTSTCAITGTPSAVSATANYTVTATNTGGSSSTVISVRVVDALPVISYSPATLNLGINLAMSAANVTNTGGVIASCSASPALPAGLSLSNACMISGTPTVQQSATNYTISATNTAGTATTNISIAVINVPSITYTGSPYTFTKGTAITTVVPNNSGSPATACSSGTWGPTGLTLNSDCSITGTPTALQTQTTYTVSNSNSNGSGANATVKITVVDVTPTISYSPTTYTFNRNVAITNITPTLGGGAVTGCASSPSLPTGLSINNTTCVISGTPSAFAASQSYTITASNTGGSATATLILSVNDTLPVLSYAGSPYSWNINTSVGTITPTNTGGAVTSCSSAPALPSGLSLSNTCTITGTPTVAQSATSYTISATNSGGTSTANLSIAVITVPAISYPGSPYTFTKGSAISPITPSNSGSPATTCTSGTWGPTGLTLNSDCSITGTPTALQTQTTYAIANSNADGSGANATVKITVVDVVPTISVSPTTYTFSRNVAITNITPTLGGGAVTGCTSTPGLPTGLSINNTTCVISGTPSAFTASQTYTITASNTGGSASANITIAVNDSVPSLTYSGSPYSWTINTSVGTITPTNTGGTVTSCSVSPSLPAGLSLSTACVVTGTPTVAQSAANYTITASNTGGSSTANISIAVIAKAALTYTGSPYTFGVSVAISTVTPSNTGSPATSCSSSPNLTTATGLTLNADCSISGTPTTSAATATYNITATNSAGTSASVPVSITVVSLPVVSYSPSSYVLTLRTATSTISISNSGGAISSCAASPVLPAGLSLSSSCSVTGSPTTTLSSTSYTVTATNAAGSATAGLTLRVKDQPEILFYGYTNTNGLWNQSASGSQNAWKITQDGIDRVALTQNTNSGLDTIYPSFIPTGAKVIFSSLTSFAAGVWNGTSAGAYNIWTESASAASETALTSNGAAAQNSDRIPQYSPNGTQIVFASLQKVSGTSSSSYNIFIANADGTSMTALTQNTVGSADSLTPVFSPDGTKIYFASRMNRTTTTGSWNQAGNLSYNIWSITTDGVTLNRITNETSGTTQRDCTEPAISPDGTTLVYTSKSKIGITTPSSTNIFTVSSTAVASSGTALTQNTNANYNSKNPKFSADGTLIAFSSQTDTTCTGACAIWNGTASSSYNIWRISSWSTTPSFSVLTTNTGAGADSATPSYAPDGSKIVFSSLQKVGGTSSSSYNIWVMNTDGTAQSALTQNTNAGLDSFLAPNGIMYIAP